MQVRLNEIPEGELTLCERFDPQALALQTDSLSFVVPLVVTARFMKERDTVVVQVEATGDQKCVCGRCLEIYPAHYDQRFDLDYSVKGKLVLDVTDDIRQEILLSYPIRFLCKEECLGLCPQCGKNLNFSACECKR